MPQRREYTEDELATKIFTARAELNTIFKNPRKPIETVPLIIDWWERYNIDEVRKILPMILAIEIRNYADLGFAEKYSEKLKEIFEQVEEWHIQKQIDALDISEPAKNENAFLNYVMEVLTRMSRRNTR